MVWKRLRCENVVGKEGPFAKVIGKLSLDSLQRLNFLESSATISSSEAFFPVPFHFCRSLSLLSITFRCHYHYQLFVFVLFHFGSLSVVISCLLAAACLLSSIPHWY